MEQAKLEGLAQANGRHGARVAANPPRATRYAVVFPQDKYLETSLQFWAALRRGITEFEGSSSRPDALCLSVYDGIDGHIDTPEYLHLVRDLRAHHVEGLIFVSNPYQLLETPIMREPGVPRVAIMHTEGSKELPVVQLDGDAYIAKSLDYFSARGRSRIAIISPRWQDTVNQNWVRAIEARGMECAKYCLQTVHVAAPNAARNCAHLLMQLPEALRPDGLVIGDDNLVEHATLGLADAGVRVPEALDVIAHCNFPLPLPSAVPVRWLGYQAGEVIRACVDSIDRQRSGSPALCKTVTAIFDDEIH